MEILLGSAGFPWCWPCLTGLCTKAFSVLSIEAWNCPVFWRLLMLVSGVNPWKGKVSRPPVISPSRNGHLVSLQACGCCKGASVVPSRPSFMIASQSPAPCTRCQEFDLESGVSRIPPPPAAIANLSSILSPAHADTDSRNTRLSFDLSLAVIQLPLNPAFAALEHPAIPSLARKRDLIPPSCPGRVWARVETDPARNE